MQDRSLIAAISSSVGSAARMIVRLSGEGATDLAEEIAPAPSPLTPGASWRHVHISTLTFPAWLYVFLAPRSYTGEDIVEFHIPGNPLLARMFLQHLTARGARPAEAGEFTARAYFNGRLDLTEAEGVAATIGARSEAEHRAARRLLSGELARRLRPVMDGVAEILALVEVGIDFAGEDVTFLSAMQVAKRIEDADRALQELVNQSAQFERLNHEPVFVLVGRPNAGKSTLLNALAGRARAVVSDIEGTTRDVLSADILLERGIVKLQDIAGLQFPPTSDAGDFASSHIARQMRVRALAAVESADFVIDVMEAADARPHVAPSRSADLRVVSKADLVAANAGAGGLLVSAMTGAGLPNLLRELDRLAFGAEASEGLALNARHLDAIAAARVALHRAKAAVAGGHDELVAFDLRESLDALGHILGAVSTDDLLGRIFSAFCIGK